MAATELRWKAAGPANVWPEVPNPALSRLAAIIEQMRTSEGLEVEEIAARQERQRRAFLGFTIEAVTFYRRIFGRLDPQIRQNLAEVWRALPILSPQDVMARWNRLKPSRLPPGQAAYAVQAQETSAGAALGIPVTQDVGLFIQATLERYARWYGWDTSARLGILAMGSVGEQASPPRTQPDWGLPIQTGPAVVGAGIEEPGALDKWLAAESPDYLLLSSNFSLMENGGADLLAVLKGHEFRDAVIHVGSPRGQRLVTALADDGTPVRAVPYFAGSGTIALPCSERGAFHVCPELAYLEIVDASGDEVRAGEPGSVVITGFHNFTWPIMRFRTEFRARWGEPCACGRTLPVLVFED